MEINALSYLIIGCAIRVHRATGPGMVEKVYAVCLQRELQKAGISCEVQVPVAVQYEGVTIHRGYRIDLLVEDQIVVEIKSVARLLPLHFAQLLTYLRLRDKRLGLLINFNVKRLADGIKRVVNRLPE